MPAMTNYRNPLIDTGEYRGYLNLMTNRITDAQFQAAQDKVDSLTRKTRRGTIGSAEEVATYNALLTEWETASGLPQGKKVDRDHRDETLLVVATKYGLVSL